MGIQYTPGATRLEVIDMFRVAAERKLPVYTHMRSAGQRRTRLRHRGGRRSDRRGRHHWRSLHIVHINSTCLRDSLECLSLVEGARARGLDVTTEAYPYIAGMTAINSALFNPGWREKLGIDYSNLVIPDTGEHLTKERFDELHNSSKHAMGPDLCQHSGNRGCNHPEPADHDRQRWSEGHPRNAGTFSRVLAQYVREKKTLTLMDALRKMTLMPAQMLERSTPAARTKGACRKAPTPTSSSSIRRPSRPLHLRKTHGAQCGRALSVVGGTTLIDDGKLVPDVFPGRALLGPGKPH